MNYNRNITVGITAFQHDSSVAVIADDKVIAFAEEERFTRQKHTGDFPFKSLQWALNEAKASHSDVHTLAFYMNPSIIQQRFLAESIPTLAFGGLKAFKKRLLWTFNFYWQLETFKKLFSYKTRIVFVPHHHCHAAYTYYLSGFESASIITLDSIGEYITTAIFQADGDRLFLIDQIGGLDSLGYVYGAITEHLGYQRGDGEGTIMALASLGKIDKQAAQDIILIQPNGRYQINRNYFFERFYDPQGHRLKSAFYKKFGPKRHFSEELLDTHKNLAATLQYAVEQAVIAYANRAIQLTDNQTICLSGGVSLNSVINHKVRQIASVRELYIAPAANDGGTSLGAALYSYVSTHKKRPQISESVYLGPSYSNEEILKTLELAKVYYRWVNNPAEIAAEQLTQGKIIGWFQGKMESGPRALGNRSILADPRKESMKHKLNNEVKFREWFRPFAPAILKECVFEWFETLTDDLPYMLEVVPIRESKLSKIPGVSHFDGTARVQTVSEENNKIFFELLKHFKKLTGVPIVINTSFNIKGEPIVAKPADALRCFYSTGLDSLIVGNYLIEK